MSIYSNKEKMEGNDYKDICRNHSAKADREMYRICPSKLSKRELEDLYFTLLENNLDLKRTINGQNDKIRLLSTQVQRMTNTQEKLVSKDMKDRGTATKAVVDGQKDFISELKDTNKRLSDRIQQLNMRLCSAKQFLKTSPPQTAPSRTNRSAVTATSTPKKHECVKKSPESLPEQVLKVSTYSQWEDKSPGKSHQTVVVPIEKKPLKSDRPCDENKCRTLMEELKLKIATLQNELFNVHGEYATRIGRLENEVVEVRKENIRVVSERSASEVELTDTFKRTNDLLAQYRSFEAQCSELTTELAIERRKVAELETQLKAANMSVKVNKTIEDHLTTKQETSGAPDGGSRDGRPRDGGRLEGWPQDGTPRDTGPKDGIHQDGVPVDVTPRAGFPQEFSPRDDDGSRKCDCGCPPTPLTPPTLYAGPKDGILQVGGPLDISPRTGFPRDRGPRDGVSRDGETRDGTPRDAGPKDGILQDGDPLDISPRADLRRDRGPRDRGPRDAGPKDGILQDGGPLDISPRADLRRDHEPRDGGPRVDDARDGGPRIFSPRGGTPRDAGPKDGILQDGGPLDVTPRAGIRRDRGPRDDGPRDGIPRDGGTRADEPRADLRRDREPRDGGPRVDDARDGGPRIFSPRGGTPRDAGPKDGILQDGGPLDVTPRAGIRRDRGPRDGGPRDGIPRDGGTRADEPRTDLRRDREPRDGGPRVDDPRDGGPRIFSPRDGISRDAGPKDGILQDGGHLDVTPRAGIRRDGGPRIFSPRDGSPRDGGPQGSVSRKCSPQDGTHRDDGSWKCHCGCPPTPPIPPTPPRVTNEKAPIKNLHPMLSPKKRDGLDDNSVKYSPTKHSMASSASKYSCSYPTTTTSEDTNCEKCGCKFQLTCSVPSSTPPVQPMPSPVALPECKCKTWACAPYHLTTQLKDNKKDVECRCPTWVQDGLLKPSTSQDKKKDVDCRCPAWVHDGLLKLTPSQETNPQCMKCCFKDELKSTGSPPPKTDEGLPPTGGPTSCVKDDLNSSNTNDSGYQDTDEQGLLKQNKELMAMILDLQRQIDVMKIGQVCELPGCKPSNPSVMPRIPAKTTDYSVTPSVPPLLEELPKASEVLPEVKQAKPDSPDTEDTKPSHTSPLIGQSAQASEVLPEAKQTDTEPIHALPPLLGESPQVEIPVQQIEQAIEHENFKPISVPSDHDQVFRPRKILRIEVLGNPENSKASLLKQISEDMHATSIDDTDDTRAKTIEVADGTLKLSDDPLPMPDDSKLCLDKFGYPDLAHRERSRLDSPKFKIVGKKKKLESAGISRPDTDTISLKSATNTGPGPGFNPEKFKYLEAEGLTVTPQRGSLTESIPSNPELGFGIPRLASKASQQNKNKTDVELKTLSSEQELHKKEASLLHHPTQTDDTKKREDCQYCAACSYDKECADAIHPTINNLALGSQKDAKKHDNSLQIPGPIPLLDTIKKEKKRNLFSHFKKHKKGSQSKEDLIVNPSLYAQRTCTTTGEPVHLADVAILANSRDKKEQKPPEKSSEAPRESDAAWQGDVSLYQRHSGTYIYRTAPLSQVPLACRCVGRQGGACPKMHTNKGTQVLDNQKNLTPREKRRIGPAASDRGTYTLDSKPTDTSADNTDLDYLSDLPSEKEKKSPLKSRPLSPGEDRTTTYTSTQSGHSPAYNYSLSEGEMPATTSRARSHADTVIDKPYLNATLTHKLETPPVQQMEAALQAINDELQRCKNLLQQQRSPERPILSSCSVQTTATDASNPIALKSALAQQGIGDTQAPVSVFTLHIGTVVLSDEAVLNSRDKNLVLKWKFYDQAVTMSRMLAGRVMLFDFSTEYDIKVTEDFLNYLKYEQMPIVICEIGHEEQPFAYCALPLRDALLNTNTRADMSIALMAGPQLKNRTHGISDALDSRDEVGVIDLWCMLRADAVMVPGINLAIAQPGAHLTREQHLSGVMPQAGDDELELSMARSEPVATHEQTGKNQTYADVGYSRPSDTWTNPPPMKPATASSASQPVSMSVGTARKSSFDGCSRPSDTWTKPPPMKPLTDSRASQPVSVSIGTARDPSFFGNSRPSDTWSTPPPMKLPTDSSTSQPVSVSVGSARKASFDPSRYPPLRDRARLSTHSKPPSVHIANPSPDKSENEKSEIIINEVKPKIKTPADVKYALDRSNRLNDSWSSRVDGTSEVLSQAHSSYGSIKSALSRLHRRGSRYTQTHGGDQRNFIEKLRKASKTAGSMRRASVIDDASRLELYKKYGNIDKITGQPTRTEQSKKVTIPPEYFESEVEIPERDVADTERTVSESQKRTAPQLEITVLWLALNEECEAMIDPHVQRLYVAYTFLGRSGAELETPVSLPKPKHYVEKCYFNFKKVFELEDADFPKLGHMARCRASNVRNANEKDCIIFSVVSEPTEDPLGIESCVDIGYAFLYLGDLLAYSAGSPGYTEVIPVRAARGAPSVTGVLAVRMDGLDVVQHCLLLTSTEKTSRSRST